MSKEIFGEASKCWNKKQDARRNKKIEQEKLEGKSLDIRDGYPLFHTREGGETIALLPPLPAQKKILRNRAFA